MVNNFFINSSPDTPFLNSRRQSTLLPAAKPCFAGASLKKRRCFIKTSV